MIAADARRDGLHCVQLIPNSLLLHRMCDIINMGKIHRNTLIGRREMRMLVCVLVGFVLMMGQPVAAEETNAESKYRAGFAQIEKLRGHQLELCLTPRKNTFEKCMTDFEAVYPLMAIAYGLTSAQAGVTDAKMYHQIDPLRAAASKKLVQHLEMLEQYYPVKVSAK